MQIIVHCYAFKNLFGHPKKQILSSLTRIELAVEKWTLNHWTTRGGPAMLLIPRMYHFSGKIISRIFFVKSLFLTLILCFCFVGKKEAPVSIFYPYGMVIGSKIIKWDHFLASELNSGSAMEKTEAST